MKAESRRTKSIDKLLRDNINENYPLKRALGAASLAALGVGATIGFAVYILPGIAAANYGGSLVVMSLILDGLLCFLFALCYAELASIVPRAGSAYTYSYATLGEIPAWITGWLFILEYSTIAALVAHGLQAYLGSLLSEFHVDILSKGSAFSQNFPALIAIAMLTALLTRGLRDSAAANNVLVLVKLMSLLLFLWLGALYLLQQGTGIRSVATLKDSWTNWGIKGLLSGAAVLAVSFMGIEAVSTASEEAKNPQRDIAIGVLSTAVVTGTFTVLVTAVLVVLVPSTHLNVLDPLAVAIRSTSGKVARILVESGALITLISSLQLLLLGLSRALFSMARDGLLPRLFSRIHPRFGTPYLTTMIVGSAAVAALWVPARYLIELASSAFLLGMILTSIAVLILRYAEPTLPRSFRVPFSPLIPILVTIGALTLLLSLPLSSLSRLGIWIAFGLLLYFAYGYRHSKIAASNSGQPLIESR